LIEDRPENRLM